MSLPVVKASAEWATRKERGSSWAIKLIVSLSLLLGRPLTRLLLYPISAYFLLVAAAARGASADYLQRLFGRRPSWRERFNHIFCFASVLHDRVFLLSNQSGNFDIRLQGAEQVADLLERHGGLLLLGAHIGSFEALRGAARFNQNVPICMAMYEGNAGKLMSVLQALNPAAALDIVPLGRIDSMLKVHERLSSGYVVGVLADRSFGDERMAQVSFLGSPAWLPLGPFRIAAMLGKPVIAMSSLYRGGNRYDIAFEVLYDFCDLPRGERASATEACMQRYTQLLEQQCRLAPYNWFNFFDFWKTPDPAHAPETH